MTTIKKEVRYVVDNCSYSDCALAARIGFVIHHGRVYPRFARHRYYRCCSACYQRQESDLIATNFKGITVFAMIILLPGKAFAEMGHGAYVEKILNNVFNHKNY